MFDLKKEEPLKIRLPEGMKLAQYKDDYFDFSKGLPNGILNKRYPGTGATYSEFMAKNGGSIIVFPFRKLAQEKAAIYEKKGCSTFYVGTDSNEKPLKKSNIKKWFKANRNSNPKFSVVADSIQKLVEVLEGEDCDPYTEFKLVLDEVELLQMQSGFRGKLPLCFDYFKKFHKKCLVSATLLEFSDKNINLLPIINLEIVSNFLNEEGIHEPIQKKNLQLRRFEKDEPHIGIANQIADHFQKKKPSENTIKFFIGLNSIQGIKDMLEVFEERGIPSISVLVSRDSRENFLPNYTIKEIENGVLPSSINISSCINWSGIDIDEIIHSVAISLNTKIHHSFGVENLVQFFGRSRISSIKNTFTLALGPSPEINHREISVSMEERQQQLRNLLDYVEENIVEKKDKFEIFKALAKTESSLIYENAAGNPAINWLLEDLEKYQNQIIDDYKDYTKGLLARLNDRFSVQEFPYDSEFEVRPEAKSDLEKVIETYQNFIGNLNDTYPDNLLSSKFKNDKTPKRIRAAAFWFYFGRKVGFTSENAKKIAIQFSNSSRSYQESDIIITALRVFIRHNAAFLELAKAIEKTKTTHNNTTSNKVLTVIKANQTLISHFKKFLYVKSADQNIAVLLRHFFGLENNTDKSKFLLKDADLMKPNLVFVWLKGIETKCIEINKFAPTKGVGFMNNELVNFIDEEFN